LLSICQFFAKGYKVLFEDEMSFIKDVNGQNLFKVEMKGEGFSLDLVEEEQVVASNSTNAT